jgi:VWFA-related protein
MPRRVRLTPVFVSPRSCFIFLVSFFLCVTGSRAGAAQASAPPVFKSGVDLVRLDVRVLDNTGAPITDIRPDEITIVDRGQRRPVLLFQHIEEPKGTYLEAAARVSGGEVSTNQGAPRGHLYVLLFDQEHITSGAEQRARLAAQAFIRRRVRPQDRVAVYGLPGPGPELDFTADQRRAIAELDKIRGGLDRTAETALGAMRVYEAYQITRGNDEVLTRVSLRSSASGADVVDPSTGVSGRVAQRAGVSEDPAITRRLITENARTVVAQADDHARRFIAIARDVMLRLSAVEGRKTIVLFSEGFFADHVQRELESLAAAAAQSYSVVYAFDLNRRSPDAVAKEPVGGEQFTETQDRIAPLGSLAAETDGALVPDAIDQLDRALNTLANASQDYYIVGFAPTSEPATGAERGEYRRVDVKVSRPGAHASVRTGYSLGPQPATADKRRALDMGLGAPFTQQGLRVDYTTYARAGDVPGVQRVFLVLNAETPVATETAHTADVAFVVRDVRTGRVAASATDTMPLPRQNAEGRATGTASYRVQFDLPPGEYLMRSVVREPGGLLGSADRRFSVRATGERDLSASDLVVGRPGDVLPVRPRVYQDGVLVAGLEVYAKSPTSLQNTTVTLRLDPIGESPSASGSIVDGTFEPPRETTSGPARAAHFELPVGNRNPGTYLAKAVVRAGDDTVAEVAREVEVLPGPPPSETTDSATAATVAPVDGDPRNVLKGEVTRDLLSAAAATSPDQSASDALSLAINGNWTLAAQKAKSLEQTAPFAYSVFAACDRFAERDYANAIALLQRASALEARDARLAFVLGWAHRAAGDLRAAIGSWRNAASLDPRLIPAHLALADAYIQLDQPALAAQALHAGLSAVPGSAELKDRLIRIERPQTRREP